MDQAFIQPLNLQDQQLLLDEISRQSNLVHQIGLTPAQVNYKNATV